MTKYRPILTPHNADPEKIRMLEKFMEEAIDKEEKKKGKCYSKCNKGQRKESDFYQTPYSITQQLLEKEIFEYDEVCDPACGEKAITKILENRFYCVIANDIKFGQNFLIDTNRYKNIITNPPFSLANEFIEKCYQVCTNKFALLMPLVYLHGQKRYKQGLFRGLTKVYVFTRMPMLTSEIREDGKYNTGMQVYAWFVFENGNGLTCNGPEIKWIDNSMYILRKGE